RPPVGGRGDRPRPDRRAAAIEKRRLTARRRPSRVVAAPMPRTALLDVDGTLVDTNYHHVIAWGRAFAQIDMHPPLWQVHRAVGMGGNQLVAEIYDDETEEKH